MFFRVLELVGSSSHRFILPMNSFQITVHASVIPENTVHENGINQRKGLDTHACARVHKQLISLVLPLSVLVLFRYPVGVILAPPLPTRLLPTLTIGHPAFLPPLFPVTSLLWSLLLPTLDKYLLPLQPYRQLRMQKKKKKKKWRWKLPRVEGHHRLIGH